MAIYAFDGTTCTPRNLSNVFRMYDAYESRHKFYATGPGSRGTRLSKVIESMTGHGGKVDFLGLYDSVGSFGNPFNMVDIGYRKSIPSGVVYCAQALSIHEERFTFRVIRATLAKKNTKTTVQECWFPGVHSDIGGTLKKGLGAASLNWMFEQASNANTDQWNKDAVVEAEENVDCNEEPSENKISLPACFLKSLRTRKIKEGDSKCCAGNPQPATSTTS